MPYQNHLSPLGDCPKAVDVDLVVVGILREKFGGSFRISLVHQSVPVSLYQQEAIPLFRPQTLILAPPHFARRQYVSLLPTFPGSPK